MKVRTNTRDKLDLRMTAWHALGMKAMSGKHIAFSSYSTRQRCDNGGFGLVQSRASTVFENCFVEQVSNMRGKNTRYMI